MVSLRSFAADDLEAYVALMNEPAILPFTPHGDAGLTMEQAQNWLMRVEAAPKTAGNVSIEFKNQWIGVIKYSTLPRNPRSIQFGYYIQAEHHGKGLGTAAVMAFAAKKEAEGCVRLQALVEPHNAASRRVMEKCSFEMEGTLRSFIEFQERLIDVCMYAKINGSKE